MLLNAVLSGNKDGIDKLINNCDTEIIAPEEIELTDNPGNVTGLTLEANGHVVEQRTTHTKEIETNKKRKKAKKECSDHMETQRSRENCLLEGRAANQFEFNIYKQIINLDVLIDILVQQCNLYLQQTWSTFVTNA